MGAAVVWLIGLFGAMGIGGIGALLLLGFLILPAFMGFLMTLAFLGTWKGLAVNIAFLLLGIYVNPWLFWGWFLFLSLIGMFVLFLEARNILSV